MCLVQTNIIAFRWLLLVLLKSRRLVGTNAILLHCSLAQIRWHELHRLIEIYRALLVPQTLWYAEDRPVEAVVGSRGVVVHLHTSAMFGTSSGKHLLTIQTEDGMWEHALVPLRHQLAKPRPQM
jgi:hypothetical protein